MGKNTTNISDTLFYYRLHGSTKTGMQALLYKFYLFASRSIKLCISFP
jgi:hypothetical protein